MKEMGGICKLECTAICLQKWQTTETIHLDLKSSPVFSNVQEPSSQERVSCGRNGWLFYTERVLSATCMGSCLGTSFQEHPKSTKMAIVGGATSMFLADVLVNRFALNPNKQQLRIKAVELLSIAGISWCLKKAFEEHPKTALKACVAGALSFCLTKSMMFNPLATVNETKRGYALRTVPDESETDESGFTTRTIMQQIGKELDKLSIDYKVVKSTGELSIRLGDRNLNLRNEFIRRM